MSSATDTRTLIVEPATSALRGSVPVPSDDLVLSARLALAAMSRGLTTFRVLRETSAVTSLVEGLQQLGVGVERRASPRGSVLRVQGGGMFGLSAPRVALDVREQAQTGALLLGLLVGRSFASELWVDELVAELLVPVLESTYPMRVERLEQGARIAIFPWTREERPPGVEVSTLGAFAWVKQAILIAGVRAATPTRVEETFLSPDHLERAMMRARLPLEVTGTAVELHPPRDDDAIAPQSYADVGSASAAAFLAAAALTVPESQVTLRGLSLNPTRTDFAVLARLMGGQTGISPRGDEQGEPVGDAWFAQAPLQAADLAGENVLRMGDAAFALLAVAAAAHGASQVVDVVLHARGGDPRIVGRAAGILRSAGVAVQTGAEGISVEGRPEGGLAPLTVTTGGDARLALLASLLALRAKGTSRIDDVDCLGGEFPRFVGTLRALGARVNIAGEGDNG